MRTLVNNDLDKCVGCNRCVRVCPVDEANISVEENGRLIVKIDNEKCIACGACISACKHESRYYTDDTKKFINDLQNGQKISMFAAPAIRANEKDWGRLITWLKNMGVNKIYDVSLGADICTWAHIRYIQKNKVDSLITQPCPAIVNYILLHKTELVKNLSPIHSPMLCTAVYMRKYEKVTEKIAALSPCIAKAHEFDATDLVSYNVTFKSLFKYIEENRIVLPTEVSGFDHYESALGGVYSQPGGLKENIEFFLGKALRVDKSEGQAVVYKAIDEFAHEDPRNLPAVFDVLNCQEGCNLGTGCKHNKSIFDINRTMQQVRQKAVENRDQEYFEELYNTYDEILKLNDFVRHYTALPVKKIHITNSDIEQAFLKLGKDDEDSRIFDCGACGSETCFGMAEKVAKGINTPLNCMQKMCNDMQSEKIQSLNIQRENLSNIDTILNDVSHIKTMADKIVSDVADVTESISQYNRMVADINKISMQINIISINTSIEAARAGEHGKSFSVVASEIRNLAKNSKKCVDSTTDASRTANTAIGSINDKVQLINQAITKSYEDVSNISENTRTLVEVEN